MFAKIRVTPAVLTVIASLLLTALPASAADVKVVKVVAGNPHSCALLSNGNLYCWGMVQETEPHFLAGAKRVTGIPPLKDYDSGSEALSCGIDVAGPVTCWMPVVEDLASEYKVTKTFALQIKPGHTLTRVAVGFSHVCALEDVGALWCAGNNSDGELGIGDNQGRNDFQKVVGLPVVIDFDTGVNNTCAVTQAGEAWCWGTDSPIENRPMIVGSNVPVRVKGPKSLLLVQDGRNSMCATSSEPAVYCWGDNIFAQLGVPNSKLGGRVQGVVANQPLDQPVISISSGMFNTCAVMRDGTVRCWGLWDMSMPIYTPKAKALPRPAVSVSLSAGGERACALLDDNGIWCWGYQRTADMKPTDESPFVETPWQVKLPADATK